MKQLSINVLGRIAVLLGLTLVLLFNVGLPTLQAQASQPTAEADCDPARHIDVSGQAVVNVTPDRALIQLGVQSNATGLDEAQALNVVTIKAVITAVKALGVDAKDIATDSYTVEPVYSNYETLFVKGYRIRNTVAITLRDVNKTGPVVVAALKAGANTVDNVDLYTSELRKYRDQARDMAIKAAREKAQALAKAVGSDVGCALTINENTSSYYNGWWWYGRSQNQQTQWTQNSVQNIPSQPSATTNVDGEPISIGQISVKADVTATFSLK